MHLPHSDGSLAKNIPVWLRKCFDHGRVRLAHGRFHFRLLSEHFSLKELPPLNTLKILQWRTIFSSNDSFRLGPTAPLLNSAAHRTMVTIRAWSTRFAPPLPDAFCGSQECLKTFAHKILRVLDYFSRSSVGVHHGKIVQEMLCAPKHNQRSLANWNCVMFKRVLCMIGSIEVYFRRQHDANYLKIFVYFSQWWEQFEAENQWRALTVHSKASTSDGLNNPHDKITHLHCRSHWRLNWTS